MVYGAGHCQRTALYQLSGISIYAMSVTYSRPLLFRPRVCKASFFELYQRNVDRHTNTDNMHIPEASYHTAKRGGLSDSRDSNCTVNPHASTRTQEYHTVKTQLRGIGGPLHGWVVCTEDYETFSCK